MSKDKKTHSLMDVLFKDSLAADDTIFSYFKAFMDDKGVAAVTPSSKYLVERVVKAMDLKNNKVVIEYGAAEGVMTWRILEKLGPDGRMLAVELNDQFFSALSANPKAKDPRLSLHHGDVRKIAAIAKHAGIEKADVIISGIPFAFLSHEGRHELLTHTAGLLRPGGRFIAYQHTTHLIPLFKKYFKDFKMQFEIRNLPPYFVFTAFK